VVSAAIPNAMSMSSGSPELTIDDASDDVASGIVGKVHAEFTAARTLRLPKDYEWWVAWQWYHGNTTVFFDASATRAEGQVYQVTYNRRHRRTRPINFIGRTIDLVVAKHMRARPIFDARAATQDEHDRLAARAMRDLARHIWLQSKLTSRRRDLFLDRALTGNGFVKEYYDATIPPFTDDIRPCPTCAGAGQMPMPPELGQQMMMMGQPASVPCSDCDGAGQKNMGRKPLGDAVVKPVSPWEIWPLKGVKKIEDGCFHAFRLSKESAAAQYKLDPETLKSTPEMREGESQFAKFARQQTISSDDVNKDMVWVIEKWLPPLPNSERPRITIVVGNQLVYPAPGSLGWESGWGETKEKLGRIPIHHFRLRPCAEEFWSAGLAMDMIACNDFINRARNNFHRHMMTMAYVKWLVEKGTIDKDAITDEVGEVIEFTGTEAPRQQQPAAMPEFYVRLVEQEEENIPKLAGLQEIDQGKAPPNVEAFQALHFLAEQSETVHGPIMLEDEENWREIARTACIIAIQNYNPADIRITRVAGGATKLEVQALMSSDILDTVDVVCEIGSALAHSPALRQEQVFRAVELGMLPPDRGMQLMEWGIILGEDSADDHRIQESVAAAENAAMQGGLAQHIVLQQSHDHAVHIRCHRRAALEAQLMGNLQLAEELDQACLQHALAMAPQPPPSSPPGSPGPQPPGTANVPFDSARPGGDHGDGQMQPQGAQA